MAICVIKYLFHTQVLVLVVISLSDARIVKLLSNIEWWWARLFTTEYLHYGIIANNGPLIELRQYVNASIGAKVNQPG